MKKTTFTLTAAILALSLALLGHVSCGGSKKGSPAPIAVTGVALDKTSISLTVGGTETLIATVQPSDAANKNVTWSSGNTSVATVRDGLVTAIAAGAATITAATQDGNKTATCAVTVSNPLTVYAAGHELGTDSNRHAMLWTNGAARQLSSNPSYANSVFVSGGDVYVAGAEDGSDGTPRATLWKNGVAQRLSDRRSEARSVSVSGNNVYVAGYEALSWNDQMLAVTLWKDGSNQVITNMTFPPPVTSLFVSGSDVYVGFAVDFAYIWKNGALMQVTSSGSARINSLYASGNTLHCAGYWRETGGLSRAVTSKVVGSEVTHQYLDAGVSEAYSVFVSGSNVYVAGYTGSTAAERRAKVWKDGAAQALSDLRSEANSVFVSDNDVYVGGHEYVGSNASDQRARVWKNGAAQNLSSRQSGVASVYVVK